MYRIAVWKRYTIKATALKTVWREEKIFLGQLAGESSSCKWKQQHLYFAFTVILVSPMVYQNEYFSKVCPELTWRFDCVVSRHIQLAPTWSAQAGAVREGQWLSALHKQAKVTGFCALTQAADPCSHLGWLPALITDGQNSTLGNVAQCCCHHKWFRDSMAGLSGELIIRY